MERRVADGLHALGQGYPRQAAVLLRKAESLWTDSGNSQPDAGSAAIVLSASR